MQSWSWRWLMERQKGLNDAVICPKCGSNRVYKDGFRYTNLGQVQRYLCRNCGFRFSESSVKVNVSGKICETFNSKKNNGKVRVASRDSSVDVVSDSLPLFFGEYIAPHDFSIIEKDLNDLLFYNSKHQVCAQKDAKNLNPQAKTKTLAEEKEQQQDIKGKLVELIFHMQKQGYSNATIRLNRIALKVLSERGANLLNPESVKETIAKQKWSQSRKRNVINAYSLFLKINDLTWEKPKCEVTRKIPFIPTEAEIDALICGTGKKTATFLQLLKETAMRCGEAKRLMWINIDSEKNTITLNEPEKGSNSRMWKVTQKLMDMLSAMPKSSQRVFGDSSINSMKTTFIRARKRLAAKLQNPRLLNISFHTLRHWKATMIYHKTKDPYYVKQFLGHKSIQNTELYINIEHTLFDSGSDHFTVKVTEKSEEVKELLEVGFEYVCQKDNLIFLRKPK
jgi:integrase/rubredoxin